MVFGAIFPLATLPKGGPIVNEIKFGFFPRFGLLTLIGSGSYMLYFFKNPNKILIGSKEAIFELQKMVNLL
jgi:hypothetical protein